MPISLSLSNRENETASTARGSADGGLTENLVALFSTVMEFAARRSAGGEQAYWANSLNQLLRNAIGLVSMARGCVTLTDLYEVITSALYSPDQVASEGWERSSTCFASLMEAEGRPGPAPVSEHAVYEVKPHSVGK